MMPEYLAPGVYVEEINIGAVSIEGVSTSTAAFIGETERGPTNPTLISGLEEYRRIFGKYTWKDGSGNESTSFMRHATEGFFTNGGKRCYIARVIGAKCSTAKLDIGAAVSGTTTTPTTRRAPAPAPRPAPASVAEPVPPSETSTTTTSAAPSPLDAAGDPRSPSQPTSQPGAANESPFTLAATGPGRWGNFIFIRISDAHLAIGRDLANKLFSLAVYYKPDADLDPVIVEQYDNLSTNPRDQNFYEQRINGYSDLIAVARNPRGGDARPGNTTDIGLKGGDDGDPVGLPDFTGEGDDRPGARSGLAALGEIDEVSIVCAPNENNFEGLTGKLVAHCENLKSRFAILQVPWNAPATDRWRQTTNTDSKYAAFYYPWLKIIDGHTDTERLVPSGGHIAGIYARSDIERGVHKAPANELVRGVTGVQFTVTTADQEILNPQGINCIRPLPGRGIRVWGARTTSSDPNWRYVNVRRLFIYLEESIRHATQWVVFEPNNEQLWDRVRQSCADFLTTVWREGALMGRTREEAFFVKCDRTIMTQNDVETGRIIIIIGVAPVRPAEFVIFRIAQWPGGSAVEG
jgi:phage tail sheath protein FI